MMQEDSYNELISSISQTDPFLLRVATTASAALVILFVALLLSISLLISFHLTLFVLSIITKSTFQFILIVAADLITALAIPPLLLNILLYASGAILLIFARGMIDYSTFTTANVPNLIVATSGVLSLVPLALPAATILISYFVFTSSGAWGGSALFINIIYHLTYVRILSFFEDTWKVIHFDFGVGIIDSAVNWAIFTDVLYSIFFLVPALAIIIVQRWSFGRRMFLNLVLWVSAHPKGVIFACGEMMLSFVSAIRQLGR
jgi:hypothetical protein